MADIRINQLPAATGGSAPVATDNIAIDGASTRKATIQQVVDTGAPIATQSEAQTGTNATKRMTPLTTKQSIASEVGVTLASAAQGALADSALQPGGAATPAQGTKADSAMQPSVYDPNSVAKDVFSFSNSDISVTRYGASTSNTSSQNEVAFNAAETAANGAPIYVPPGTFQLSTPMNRGYKAQYYGRGVLRFDNAEWWRRGGSSGDVSRPERYTLFYEYDSQADVSVKFDGVAQTISWIDDYTVQAPGSTTAVAVIINIVNGRYRLGPAPESIRSYNVFMNGGGKIEPLLASPTQVPVLGFNNASLGPRSLQNITTGGNNTAFGSRVLTSLKTGENNTGFGFQALYRAIGSENTAIGSVALEWLTTGIQNTALGAGALGGLTTGNGNTGLGYTALNEVNVANYCTAIGYRALGNPGPDATFENCVFVGAFAGDFNRASSNTGVGYRALNGDGGALTGADNVGFGSFAGRRITTGVANTIIGSGAGIQLTSGARNVAIGCQALSAETGVSDSVAVGYQALKTNLSGIHNTGVGFSALMSNVSGADNTALGWSALPLATGSQNTALGSRSQEVATTAASGTTIGFEAGRFLETGTGNTFIGSRAGRQTTSANENTAIGQDALQFNTTGAQNTALGKGALRLDQASANQTTFNNTTGVGFGASVSGSNQVQLGNSATTTYVYGTVQNRSDERDKADIRDTELGLDFIMALRPVDYRWDMREDYIEVDEATGKVKRLKKDGSKKRKRFHHGFSAQDVLTSGFDFGGIQDHSKNGGSDILSLGYDEFIAPLVRAIQEQQDKIKKLEKKISSIIKKSE